MLSKVAAAGLALAAFSQAATVSVDPQTEYQTYDGTGCSEAFQRSLLVHELDADHQSEVLDLLFTEKGAGFTILRNGLGSSTTQPFDLMKSIAPKAPANNETGLNYIPLPRNDQYQVWLSKQAKARGVNYIYADAWSADGYMKTNGTDTYGGYLCGVFNTSCEYDWRQAYADKIVHYIQDYAAQGIHIDYVGFLNEPDLETPYASMQSSGRQAADFIKILHPTIQEAGLDTEIACCDGSGWEQQRERLTGIQANHQAKNLGLVTSHGYSSYPGAPFQTKLKTWQTEWSTFDNLNYNWYTQGGSQSDGLTWANNIRNSFGTSNVTGFLYWWGAAEKNNTNEGLIYINSTGTDVVKPTKRLWAHAHFGKKFIREGATRIDATSSVATLNVTAFANTDGTTAVQVINNGDASQKVTLSLPDLSGATVATFLTNQDNDLLEGTATIGKAGKSAKATVPGRSLLSFYVSS